MGVRKTAPKGQGVRKRKPRRNGVTKSRKSIQTAKKAGNNKQKKKKNPSRPSLHELDNITNAEKTRRLRSRLPRSDDPFEEPCFEADLMPEGFVFVPKGDRYVTRNCKTRSKDLASTVYMVYDNRAKEQLGIRVKKEIHTYVTILANETAENRAAAVLLRDARDQKKAKKILEETFPNMPAKCGERILEHSFLKGSGRVGRSTTQPEALKARLAVEAHIRHEHTPYDSLLDKGIDREDARDMVRKSVHTMRDQWAGKSKVDASLLAGELLHTSRRRRKSTSSATKSPSPEIIVID